MQALPRPIIAQQLTQWEEVSGMNHALKSRALTHWTWYVEGAEYAARIALARKAASLQEQQQKRARRVFAMRLCKARKTMELFSALRTAERRGVCWQGVGMEMARPCKARKTVVQFPDPRTAACKTPAVFRTFPRPPAAAAVCIQFQGQGQDQSQKHARCKQSSRVVSASKASRKRPLCLHSRQ